MAAIDMAVQSVLQKVGRPWSLPKRQKKGRRWLTRQMQYKGLEIYLFKAAVCRPRETVVGKGGGGRGRAWSSVESMRRAKRESVHTNSKTRRCVEESKSSGLRRQRAVPKHNALCQGGRWVMATNARERRKVHRRSAERQFGFAEVDIEVPRELWEKFEEMPPLFYTKPVASEAVPQHMKDYLARSKLKPMHDQRRLVGALSAPKILMYSPLLK